MHYRKLFFAHPKPVKLFQVPNIFVRVKQVLLVIGSRVSILLVSQD